jgi:23S rRNA maturation-related 3'-5' exoribonuclease YhaM
MENHKGKKMVLNIILHAEYKNIKNIIKKMLGKKYRAFYDLQTINDLILANIIAHYRNQYYEYEWNRSGNSIQLNIKL